MANDLIRTNRIKEEKEILMRTRNLVLEITTMFNKFERDPFGLSSRDLLESVLVSAETFYIPRFITFTTSQMLNQVMYSVLDILSYYVGIPSSSVTAIRNAALLDVFVEITDSMLSLLKEYDNSLAIRHATFLGDLYEEFERF